MAQTNPLRYRSYYYDSETGYYHLKSRYYSPEVGRWISPAPSNVLGKVGKKLVEDGVDMALDLTQTATENGGLTGKDVLFSAVTSFGGDLVGAAKTNSTARNQLIDGATDNRAIKDAVGDSLTDNKAVKNAIADSATDNKAVKNAVKDSISEATNVGLKNGSKLKTNDALDAAEDFLGKGYKDAGNVVLFRLMVQRLLEWEIMIFWENMVVDHI